MKRLTYLGLAVLLSLTAMAQQDWSDNLSETDREALEALVLYPAQVRQAIFNAGMHPEILVRIERLQQESQANFENTLRALPQSDQEALWEMTRYPGLMEEISRQGSQGTSSLQQISAKYDEDIRPTIMDQGQRNPSMIAAVHNSSVQAESAYRELLSPYSLEVQNAYSTLVGMPELLEILTNHLSLTVLVSDYYRKDPVGVNTYMDKLAVEAAERQNQALQDWQNQLDSDPQMRAELESATAEFAREAGWSDEEYSVAPAQQVVERRVEVQYVYQPYPYWFGYPWWTPYPRWYPYPWWYDWGFYYGPRSSMVVFGMPSYSFWVWYYRTPYRHYYYPHLTNGCVTYYQTHRRTGVALNGPTREFIARSEPVVGRNWLDASSTDRVAKIRDYGKLEMDYAAQQSSGSKSKTRVELLQENPKKYSSLPRPTAQSIDPDRTSSRPSGTIRTESGTQSQSDRGPAVRPTPDRTVAPAPTPAPAPNTSRSKGTKPSAQPSAPSRVIERPQPAPSRTTTRPEDLHRGSWTAPSSPRAQPSAPRVQPSAPSRPSAAPQGSRTSPSRAPAPSRTPSAPRSGSPR